MNITLIQLEQYLFLIILILFIVRTVYVTIMQCVAKNLLAKSLSKDSIFKTLRDDTLLLENTIHNRMFAHHLNLMPLRYQNSIKPLLQNSSKGKNIYLRTIINRMDK